MKVLGDQNAIHDINLMNSQVLTTMIPF